MPAPRGSAPERLGSTAGAGGAPGLAAAGGAGPTADKGDGDGATPAQGARQPGGSAGVLRPPTPSPPVPADEGTEVVEDPNGKTFTVSSRVEFRVTKEDNEAEVTCTVDHESLQNSERSTTQKLQVHCAWGRWGSRGRGQGCGGVGGEEEEEAASASPSHSWPYAYPQPARTGACTGVLSHAG